MKLELAQRIARRLFVGRKFTRNAEARGNGTDALHGLIERHATGRNDVGRAGTPGCSCGRSASPNSAHRPRIR
jgi:hypothetical protein